jgi:hypothetical protein
MAFSSFFANWPALFKGPLRSAFVLKPRRSYCCPCSERLFRRAFSCGFGGTALCSVCIRLACFEQEPARTRARMNMASIGSPVGAFVGETCFIAEELKLRRGCFVCCRTGHRKDRKGAWCCETAEVRSRVRRRDMRFRASCSGAAASGRFHGLN